MLRVTIHDSASEFRLHLEGRLAGPWVREVELCWQTALSTVRDRAVIVDLREIDFVDAAGEQLLATMHQRGAKLVAACPFMKHLISEISGAPEEALQPAPVRRKPRLRLRLLSLFLMTVAVVLADSSLQPEQVLAGYVKASRAAKSNSQDEVMSVQIDATLPKLHKHGALHALRFISRLGSVSYRPVLFEGDRTIEKSVIARYLSVEEEAGPKDVRSFAVTPANYRFHFERLADYNGVQAYVFRLEPRRKQIGLFRGELWLDSATFLPLREWGELVKSPSIFLKSVYFVRDYTIAGGRSVPRRTITDIDTRVVGKAELTIWFDPVASGEQASEALRYAKL